MRKPRKLKHHLKKVKKVRRPRRKVVRHKKAGIRKAKQIKSKSHGLHSQATQVTRRATPHKIVRERTTVR